MAEFGSQAQEGNELPQAQLGVRIFQKLVEAFMAEHVEMDKALPLQLAQSFQSEGPKLLGCQALGFHGCQGGIGRVQSPGGGALLPTVAGAELADGWEGAAKFVGYCLQGGIGSEFQV